MFSFHKRLSWRLLSGLLVMIMLLTATPNVAAMPTDSTDYGVQHASPAVVRIITTVEGTVKYLDKDSRTITFPLDGGTYAWIFSGSGALIGPDGYVLTADHVVEFLPNDPYIQGLFFKSLTQDKTLGISKEEALRFFNQNKDRLSYSYEVTKQQVFLSTAYMGTPLHSVTDTVKYEARRLNIIASSPPDVQDVAIIKVEASDLPYLPLAPASSIHVPDSVTAIAFPGDTETSSFVELTDPKNSTATVFTQLLTPSVEEGKVIARKPLPDGTMVYEVTNIASQGSSGGPVINSQGQIIGFVDAASSNQRVTFLIPSEVISTYTRKAGMPLLAGAFMSLWDKAIREYNTSGTCHWTQAYQDLNQLHAKYPQFGGVEPFLTEAKAKAKPSECPPPPPPSNNRLADNWPLLAGLGAAVVLLGGIGFSLFVLPRRKKARPQAMAATTSTSADTIPAFVLMPDSMADGGKQTEGTSIQASPTSPEPAPAIRKCISGHVVTLETAHFCPECGAAIEEPKESKVPQGQTTTFNGHDPNSKI